MALVDRLTVDLKCPVIRAFEHPHADLLFTRSLYASPEYQYEKLAGWGLLVKKEMNQKQPG